MAILTKTVTQTFSVETDASIENTTLFSYAPGTPPRLKATVHMGNTVGSVFLDTVLTAAQMSSLTSFFRMVRLRVASSMGFV